MKTAKLCADSMFKRFLKLQKFKKKHRNVSVLKKGFATTGCGYSYYWAEVQYEF